jgi:chromosome segregation ATPase
MIESVHTRIPAILIPVDEYNGLKNDVAEKDKIIRDLNHRADMLRLEMEKNHQEIKESENANKEYKIKIDGLIEKTNDLTKRVEQSDEEIEGLKIESNGQKNWNLEMLQQIQQLEKINQEKENKNQCKKLCIAIRDLNNRYGIEKKINDMNHRETLRELGMDWDGISHYCDKSLSDEEASQMFYLMNQKINDITPWIEEWFWTNYPMLLSEIIGFLALFEFPEPSDRMLDYANRQWDRI